jgi:hypothetical protein
MVWDLDEAINEVKLFGEHDEEASQKITGLEALCRRLREEKTKMDGMVESLDELIMEFTDKYGYSCSDEDADDEDEDDDDRGDAVAPLLLCHYLHLRHLLLPERRSSSMRKTPWRWFLSKRPLKCMMLSWQIKSLSCRSLTSSTFLWGTMWRARQGWWMIWMTWMTR